MKQFLRFFVSIFSVILFTTGFSFGDCPPVVTITNNGQTVAGSSVSFCTYDNVILSTPAAGVTTFQWYDLTGPIGAATSSSYQVITGGTYWVEITGSFGTCSSGHVIASLKQSPVINVVATGTVLPVSGTDPLFNYCCTDNVSLLISTVPPNLPFNYFFNGIPTPTYSTNPVLITSGTCQDQTITITAYPSDPSWCVSVKTITVHFYNVSGGLVKDDQTICEGDVAATLITDPATPASGGVGPYSYQWYSSTTSCLTSGMMQITNATSETYSPGQLFQTTYFRRTAKATGCAQVGFSNCITVTVNLKPVMTSQTTMNICTGEQISLKYPALPTFNVPVSYSWTSVFESGNPVTGNGAGGPTTGPITDILSLNPPGANDFGTIRYTITPSAGPAPTNCPSIPKDLLVQVNPIPILTNVTKTADICSGTTFGPVDLTSNISVADFEWNIASLPTGVTVSGASSGFGDLPAALMISTSDVPQIVTYNIRPFIGTGTDNCPGSWDHFVVTVQPAPIMINNPTKQYMCSGDNSSPVTLIPNLTGNTFTWISSPLNSNLTGVSPSSGGSTTLLPSQQITNLSNIRQFQNYHIMPDINISSSCNPVAGNYQIHVMPEPRINSSFIVDPICSGQAFTYTMTSNVSGVTFDWNRTADVSNTASSGITPGISEQLYNNLTIPLVVTYHMRATTSITDTIICHGNYYDLQVTVNPLPVITIAGALNVATGATEPYTTQAGMTEYTWTLVPPGCGSITPVGNIATVTWSSSGQICVNYKNNYGCLAAQAKCISVNVSAQPNVYNVIPSSGIFCEGAIEGEGAIIGLDNSQGNIQYDLIRTSDGSIWDTRTGLSGPFNFTRRVFVAGIYRVKATNTTSLISIWMNGQCVVSESPNPVQYSITPVFPQHFCLGGVNIGTSGSETNVKYWLMHNGVIPDTNLVSGTPGTGTNNLDFGSPAAAGSYQIYAAKNGTGCDLILPGIVYIEPKPDQYYFLPAGEFCAGEVSNFTLSGSQAGFKYDLHNITTNMNYGPFYGAPGGGPINFGAITDPGVYEVIATDVVNPAATYCQLVMINNVTIHATPQQNHMISPQGAQCEGIVVSLLSSETGIWYHLYRMQSLIPPVQFNEPPFSSRLGNGLELNFGSPTVQGSYMILAVNRISISDSCIIWLPGSIDLCKRPLVKNLSPSGHVCQINSIEVLDHQPGMTYQLIKDGIYTPPYQEITAGAGSVIFTPIPGPYFEPGSYIVRAISACAPNTCDQTMNGMVNIDMLPTVDAGADQIICADPSTQITLTGTASNYDTDPVKILWEDKGIPGTIISPHNLITGYIPGVATGTRILRLTVQGQNGCQSVSVFDEKNVVVNPYGQVNQPSNQVLCPGDITSAVTFTTNNTGGVTTYAWTNNNISIGLGSGASGDIPPFTAVNTGSAPEVATITVTPTFTNGGMSCPGQPRTFTLTVNPKGQVNQPGDQVVCNGNTTVAVTFATVNTGGSTTYTWTNSNSSIGLATGGSGIIPPFIAVNTGSTAQVAIITVTPTFTNGNVNCAGTPKTFRITVNPSGQVNDPANMVVCNGATTSAIVFTTNNSAGTTSYTWTNNQPSIGLPSNGTGNIPVFNAINTGTAPVNATITVIPTLSSGGIDCPGTPQSFTITVDPTGQVNLPSNLVVCNGNLTSTLVLGTNNSGGLTTYNWTNNQPSIGLPSTGTGNIPAFTAINNGTALLIATLTITPVFSNGGIDCPGTPKTLTITVNPTGEVNVPPNLIVCNGSTASAGVFGTNNTGGTTIYNWTNNVPAIGLSANGTGNINPFTAINNGTTPVVATISVTPAFSNGGVNCPGPVQTFTITVNPSAQVIVPANIVVCNGNSVNTGAFGTNNTGGITTYSWINSQPTIGLPASGTGNIPVFTSINNGTSPVVATITVTPSFSAGSVSCPGIPQTFTITVNPNGQVNIPVSQDVCNGSLTSTVLFGTNNSGGTTSYNWVNNTPSIGLPASGSGNIPAFTALNPGIAPVVASITVTPAFSNGSVDCEGPPQIFTITVNPTGQINAPANIIVCNGGSTGAILFGTNNSGGTTTYSWTNTLPTIGLPASGSGNINSFTAINAGISPVTATITVTPVFSNGGTSCPGSSLSFTLTVNPTGQVNLPANQLKCNGDMSDPITFSTNNSGGSTTYSWVNSNPGIGLPASGTGDIATFPTTNPGSATLIGTITVTPHFFNGSITCDGPGQSFTISVFASFAAGSISADQDICYNSAPALLEGTPPAGGNAPYSYQWQYSTDGLSWNNVVTGGTSLNYQPGILIQTTKYRLQQTSNNSCGSKITNTVSINIQVPTAYAGPNDSICGLIPYVISHDSANYAVNYSWSTSGTGTFSPQFQLHTTYYPSAADMNMGSVMLTLTITDKCNYIVTDHMTLTLGQNPAAFFTFNTPACSNTPIDFNDQSTVANGFIRRWEWDFDDGTVTPPILWPANPDIQHTFSPPGPSYLVKLKVYTSLECTSEFQQVVTILNAPVASFTLSDITCDNQPVLFTNTSMLNGAQGMQPWSWDFGDPGSGTSNASNLSDPVHQFSHWGDFTVRLIVINSNNCRDTMIKQPVHINKSPRADFTHTVSCEGNAMQFTDVSISNATSIVTYLWDFGDGGPTSNLQNPEHTFSSYGLKNVKLTVTNDNGCTRDTVKQVLVNPKPIPEFTFSSPNCSGSVVQFTNQSTTVTGFVGPITKWEWDFGDGSITPPILFPHSPDTTHIFPGTSSSYTVRLTVTTSNGCVAYIEHTVIVAIGPIANFTYATANCSSVPVQFTDHSQTNGGGLIQSWLWDFGDVPSGSYNTSTLQNPTHTFSGTGPYTVSLHVTNQNGCTASYQSPPISISARPISNFTADTACLGSATHFANTATSPSGNIVTWHWDFGDGQTAVTANPTHTYPTSGVFSVALTVTDILGCSKDTTKQVLVIPKPIALFTFSSYGCSSDSVHFTDLSVSPHGYLTTWLWDFGDGNVETRIYPQSPNVAHKYSNGGTYFVRLIVESSDQCSATNATNVIVQYSPSANFEFAPVHCAHIPVPFTDLSQENGGGAIVSWFWNFGDPLSGVNNTSTVQNPQHSYMTSGQKSVTLLIVNASGCSGTISKPITINASPVASFTATGSCINSPSAFHDNSTTPAGSTLTTWLWNFGDVTSGTNNTSTLQNPSHTYINPGTYFVSLTIHNSNQCEKDTLIPITVNPRPTAQFSSSTSCAGDSTYFQDLSIAPGSYITGWRWNFGDGSAGSTLQNPYHTFAAPGTFNVKLVVTNVSDCQDSVTVPVIARPKPVAGFAATSMYCPKGLVHFEDQSQAVAGSISERLWTFEPGHLSTLVDPDYTFSPTNATYPVSLVVTDNHGCKDTIVKNVFVNPGFSFTFSSDTACFSNPTHFHAVNLTPGDSLYNVTWNFDDPSTGPDNTSHLYNPEHTFSHTGSFHVQLKVHNSDNCVDSIPQVVTVYRLPVPLFSTSTVTCNDTAHFTDLSLAGDGTISRWTWNFGDNTTLSINAPGPGDTSHVYAHDGVYSVSLKIMTSYGCVDSLSALNKVAIACIASAYVASDTVCSKSPVLFTDSSSPVNLISTWYWHFGDGSSGWDTSYSVHCSSLTHKYTQPGLYTTRQKVTTIISGILVSDSSQRIILVKPSPTAGFASNKYVCNHDSLSFHYLPVPGDTIVNYHWTFGDPGSGLNNSVDSITDPAHYYSKTGLFWSKLRVTNQEGCKDSASKQIKVHKLPLARFSVPDTLCSRQPVALYNSTVAGDTTIKNYTWHFSGPANPSTVSHEQNPDLYYDSEGRYIILLQVNDQFNCKDTVSDTIQIKPSPISSFTVDANYQGTAGKIKLINNSTGASDYLWTFRYGSPSTSNKKDPDVVVYKDTGTYLIRLVAYGDIAFQTAGCNDTSYYNYTVEFKGLFVPNAFAPMYGSYNTNMDVTVFRPVGVSLMKYDVQVYDTWGHLLWESTQLDDNGVPTDGWDGTYNGTLQPQGTYMWKISATFKDGTIWEGTTTGSSGGEVSTVGTVTLIR